MFRAMSIKKGLHLSSA